MDETDLLKQAQAEPPRISTAALGPVIVELRSKGFSFRAIRDWLAVRGVEADHNAVYRAYRRAQVEPRAQVPPTAPGSGSVSMPSETDGDPVRWL